MFFLRRRRPPSVTRADTLLPYASIVRSGLDQAALEASQVARADIDDGGQAVEQGVDVAGLGGHHLERVGTLVARQHQPVAVEDFAAARDRKSTRLNSSH